MSSLAIQNTWGGANGIISKGIAEFFGMLLFVYIGVGTAMTPTRTVFQIALAFGMGIVILAYSIGNKSGGHINCAVTTCLMVAGRVPILEGITIIVFQFLGSLAGAGLLAATIPEGKDASKCFGTNSVSGGFSDGNAFCGEFFMTFLLMYVVLHTAVHAKHSIKTDNAAALAIGMSVFCAHCVLIPITGCSINPTRTFGPAVLSSWRGISDDDCHQWQDIYIFFLAPEAAAIFAGILWHVIWKRDETAEPGHPKDAAGDPAALSNHSLSDSPRSADRKMSNAATAKGPAAANQNEELANIAI
jgi:MIP family channel proteins